MYPSEVEAALQSIPDVQRAVVVDLGVSPALPRRRARRAAAGRATSPSTSFDASAAARLSAFKVPTAWAIVDAADVPLLATGKVDNPLSSASSSSALTAKVRPTPSFWRGRTAHIAGEPRQNGGGLGESAPRRRFL